jgi:cobalt-zinc-cadmium efflux system protein
MSGHAHGEGEAEQSVLTGLKLAVELSLVILVVEAAGAYFSRSLSLTVDAVHNIPDILAFLISWSAIRTSSEGATGRYTFGTHRFETFAGLFNAILVLATGIGFGYEATVTLLSRGSFEGPVVPIWILAVALPTLLLRTVNLSVLRRVPGRVRDLNLRSVVVHLASDVAITGALIVAGVVLVLRPGLFAADEVAALAIAAILVYESIPLFRDASDILTERTPRGISVDEIAAVALKVPGVAGIHDIHVWSVCSSLVVLTAHVDVPDLTMSQSMEVLSELRSRIEQEFGIAHSTLELEGPRSGAPRPPPHAAA